MQQQPAKIYDCSHFHPKKKVKADRHQNRSADVSEKTNAQAAAAAAAAAAAGSNVTIDIASIDGEKVGLLLLQHCF